MAINEKIKACGKIEKEKRSVSQKCALKRNILPALLVAAGYVIIYLIGRVVWCDLSQSGFIGWLFTAMPSGEHSYLYGWLLSSHLFWCAMAISVISVLFGKSKFSYITLLGFVIGIAAGMISGPNPQGAAMGQGHYGWAIWGIVYLVSTAAGIVAEICCRKLHGKTTDKNS